MESGYTEIVNRRLGNLQNGDTHNCARVAEQLGSTVQSLAPRKSVSRLKKVERAAAVRLQCLAPINYADGGPCSSAAT